MHFFKLELFKRQRQARNEQFVKTKDKNFFDANSVFSEIQKSARPTLFHFAGVRAVHQQHV